jgi:hypothetical protein
MIEIYDPVAGKHYSLDPRNHIARQMPTLPPPGPALTAPMIRAGVPAVFMQDSATFSTAAAPVHDPAAAQTQRPQFSHESLGTQTIEGVMAQGERSTVIYPVGFFGNDRPVTTMSESWTSPELKITILSKNSDPRNGDSTTRLTNISRAEPDASLFQIPSDYQIVTTDQR